MTHAFLGRRGRPALIFATALLALGATGTASAATTTFSNSSPITIPDNGQASPYPSTINATGLAGNVQKATVTLHNFTHTCPEDLSVLLVGPSGAKSILMFDVGGCPGTDIGLLNLTFDQAAPTSIETSVVPASGAYKPSATGTPDSLSSPAPGGPYSVNLDVFTNGASNGVWSLFIEDGFAEDQGSVSGGWSLALTAPVNTVTAGKPKLSKKKGTARIPVTVGDAGQLTLSGKGIKAKSTAVSGPGTVNLVVKLKGKSAKKLNSTGKAKAKANITFTPTGGTAAVTTKKLKLKKS